MSELLLPIDTGNPSLPLENARHDRFAFEYALLGNATQSYLNVYKCQYETARNEGHKLLAKPAVRARINFIQRSQTDLAFSTIVKQFEATKPIIHDSDAIITYVPDNQARIAAATVCLKANGRMNDGQSATGAITNTINNMTVTIVNTVSTVAERLGMIQGIIAPEQAKAIAFLEAEE